MTTAAAHSLPSCERYQGCLIGGLGGDCLGEYFERMIAWGGFKSQQQADSMKSQAIEWVNTHSGGPKIDKTKDFLKYTDDTAMARDLCASILHCGKFDSLDLSKRFAKTYFDEWEFRGYGRFVGVIFDKLDQSEYKLDPIQVASEQFSGTGSYGNGAAMRVAPIALFEPHDIAAALKLAQEQAQMTHTHPHGVLGSQLQTAAVYFALHAPEGSIENNREQFVDQLQEIVHKLIEERYKADDPERQIYHDRLVGVKDLLQYDAPTTEVVEKLSNTVDAHGSVATAVYVFLRSLRPLDWFESDNPLLRTITLSISLAGDTDTIACMASAMCGAYFGRVYIPAAWKDRLEGYEEIRKTAKEIHKRADRSKLSKSLAHTYHSAVQKVFSK